MIITYSQLTKSALILLGSTAATSILGAGIYKEILWSGRTTLIISNEEIEVIMKIVKCLEDYDLLIKDVIQTIENKTKE